MGILGKGKAPRDKRKEEKAQQAMIDQNRIQDSQIEMRQFRISCDNKLAMAIREAKRAIDRNDVAGKANAFFDIRLALKIRSIAHGLESAVTRMASVLEAIRSIEDADRIAKLIRTIVGRQAPVSVNRLVDTYNRTMGMVDSLSKNIDRITASGLNNPLLVGDGSISDQDIERLVKGEVSPEALQANAVTQNGRGGTAQQEGQGKTLTPEPAEQDDLLGSADTLLADLQKLIDGGR